MNRHLLKVNDTIVISGFAMAILAELIVLGEYVRKQFKIFRKGES